MLVFVLCVRDMRAVFVGLATGGSVCVQGSNPGSRVSSYRAERAGWGCDTIRKGMVIFKLQAM